MKHQNVTQFFLHLSTVVIGILITFGGSALLQNRADKKEASHLLSMVRDELTDNLDIIKAQRLITINDSIGAAAMKPYIHSPKLMPVDSLVKHIGTIIRGGTFNFFTTSFDVLKSSSQIQTIRNKELLRELFQTYYMMSDVQDTANTFNTTKAESIFEFARNVMDTDMPIAQINSEERLYGIFADMVNTPQIRNYILVGASLACQNTSPIADSLIIEITKVIDKLDKEIAR